MITAPSEPAHLALLKRRPRQARSIARVDAILDAAAALLADGDIEALTMRAVATRAGVPPATIYQFFDDKHALVQAVAARYVASTPDVLDETLRRRGPWRDALVRTVDAYASQLARNPAMRALWLAGAMDETTRGLAIAADDAIAARLRDHLTTAAGHERAGVDAADWRFLVTLISNLLRLAFAADPDGDPEVLERAKHVASLYAADLLSDPGLESPDRRPADMPAPG